MTAVRIMGTEDYRRATTTAAVGRVRIGCEGPVDGIFPTKHEARAALSENLMTEQTVRHEGEGEKPPGTNADVTPL